MKRPTPEEASAKSPIPAENWSGPRFACWHPQWGGYTSPCIVESNSDLGGCFTVYNWHDGEFGLPEDSAEPPDEKHYCDPMQLVSFGLTVLEQQADGTPITTADVRKQLEETAERIRRLLAP
jgi:hypothetical protein